MMIDDLLSLIGGRIGSRMRWLWYRWQLALCKGYFVTFQGVVLEGCENIYIGKNCAFNRGTLILSSCGISFGDDVMVGPYCVFRDSNHGYTMRTAIRKQEKDTKRIVIGNDVWIGSHCTILKGAFIESGAVIAAMSLVNRRIPSNEVWGGVPARFIKKRSSS